jgi:hypothetical protein
MNNNSNNENNNDIENQNYIIDGKYLDNDETFVNESNSPLERFKILNTSFGSNFVSSNNFRKSQSYPNNYICSNKFQNNFENKNISDINSNNIELVEQSSNPLINNIDDTNETNEASNLIISSNSNDYIRTNYFTKIYNWIGVNKISFFTEILNKFISIFLHIFIMIVFEIYFYFNFVVDIEKEEFLNKIQQYIDEFTHNINLDNTQKELIYQLIRYKYDNTLLTELYTLYIQSLEQQKELLYHLMIKSCKVAGIFGLVLFGFIGYGLLKRYKIKWKWVWMENFLMFAILGIFEYWFFINVILNYNPITDAEIKYYVANEFVNYFNSTI